MVTNSFLTKQNPFHYFITPSFMFWCTDFSDDYIEI